MSLPRATTPSRRRFLAALPLLALAACGFEPVYGPGGVGTALQNRVLIDAPEDRYGYFLVRELESQLGRASTPAWGLALTTTTSEDGLAIDSEGNTRRYNLLGTTTYALRDLSSGQIVTSGKVESFTGYSATGTTVATRAAELDAQERLMAILADLIVSRLYAADLSE
jgi:LPS-assembly lipoprotein